MTSIAYMNTVVEEINDFQTRPANVEHLRELHNDNGVPLFEVYRVKGEADMIISHYATGREFRICVEQMVEDSIREIANRLNSRR
jgi:hypothetical protein